MNHFPNNRRLSRLWICLPMSCLPVLCLLLLCAPLLAQERRARPPQYSPNQFRGVFYEDITSAVDADRPPATDLGALRVGVSTADGIASGASPESGKGAVDGFSNAGQGGGKWLALADPVDLEDEIKRIKMGFDSLITTPGRFKSGDYRDVRGKMFVLSTLLAVVSEYEGDVRFKGDAAVARDILSRSAINLTGDSFGDAKQRKADLQDLVSGGGLGRSVPTGSTDWTTVATRSALMDYLEDLMAETLRSGANDAAAFAENKASLKRAAAMVAIVGHALNEEGMEEADDADYRAFSDAMKAAALNLRGAIAGNDADSARLAVGAISQSCSSCHEQYR